MSKLSFLLTLSLVGLALGFGALRDLSNRMYIGSAINTDFMNLSYYRKISAREFNMATAEWEMKWTPTEPEQGNYTYALGDQVYDFAIKHGMQVRGHALIWHHEVPAWVFELDADELKEAIRNRIINEVTHYKGKIYSWDVVNEPIGTDGALNNSFYYEKLGVSYITDAFHLTRELDPDTKLYLNDYFTDGFNAKSDGLYKFVKWMIEQGVPIDGVGFQGHFFVGLVPDDIEENLQRFIDLGLEVAFTEFDVHIRGEKNETSLAQQAEDFATVLSICEKLEKCVGVTFWGWCDRFSYLPRNAPHLWDADLKPKPAWWAVKNYLSSSSRRNKPHKRHY